MSMATDRRVVDILAVRDMVRDIVLSEPDKRAKPFYVINDQPNCVVGVLFHRLGWPVVEYLGHDALDWREPSGDVPAYTLAPRVGDDLGIYFTNGARVFLENVQSYQDEGNTWWDAYYLAVKGSEVEIEKAIVQQVTFSTYAKNVGE